MRGFQAVFIEEEVIMKCLSNYEQKANKIIVLAKTIVILFSYDGP